MPVECIDVGKADQKMARAEARVRRQRELVERLAGEGVDTTEAKALLAVMETVLEQMRGP
jgi:hypothetical protein